MGTIINDVQVGKDTRIDICSVSHGRKRVPMADTLSFTPAKSVALVGEFDNRYMVLGYETFEGVDVAFEVIQSDQTDVDNMIMDIDPNTNVTLNDPAQHQPVTVFANYTGHNTGYKYAAEYAEGLHVSARPSTHTLKDATKVPLTFKGTRYVRVAGKTGQKCSIQYNRFLASASTLPASFSTPDDVLLVGSTNTNGVFVNNTNQQAVSPIALPLTGATGALTVGSNATNYIQAKKNGKVLTYNTDFTITSTNIALTAPLGATDVVEIWFAAQV